MLDENNIEHSGKFIIPTDIVENPIDYRCNSNGWITVNNCPTGCFINVLTFFNQSQSVHQLTCSTVCADSVNGAVLENYVDTQCIEGIANIGLKDEVK